MDITLFVISGTRTILSQCVDTSSGATYDIPPVLPEYPIIVWFDRTTLELHVMNPLSTGSGVTRVPVSIAAKPCIPPGFTPESLRDWKQVEDTPVFLLKDVPVVAFGEKLQVAPPDDRLYTGTSVSIYCGSDLWVTRTPVTGAPSKFTQLYGRKCEQRSVFRGALFTKLPAIVPVKERHDNVLHTFIRGDSILDVCVDDAGNMYRFSVPNSLAIATRWIKDVVTLKDVKTGVTTDVTIHRDNNNGQYLLAYTRDGAPCLVPSGGAAKCLMAADDTFVLFDSHNKMVNRLNLTDVFQSASVLTCRTMGPIEFVNDVPKYLYGETLSRLTADNGSDTTRVYTCVAGTVIIGTDYGGKRNPVYVSPQQVCDKYRGIYVTDTVATLTLKNDTRVDTFYRVY